VLTRLHASTETNAHVSAKPARNGKKKGSQRGRTAFLASASFSASFCLRVPFFLGAATTGVGIFSDSEAEEASQSSCAFRSKTKEPQKGRENAASAGLSRTDG
jgi:hypothetical protein